MSTGMTLVEGYENGEVELRIYNVEGNNKYWLRAGAALLEFDDVRFYQLLELLSALVEERLEEQGSDND